ncbi:4-hydroxy-4-methyl-2-oxoglutarate aldolase [Pigmentiphaga humi]|uniref:Putative 4-hydroxy-4-methyl-2-oxoglutarate aldolase n=1 Tax=Pigmentiphaga humi TaxID=2478468 RepID=A0A3P4AZC7_9BURK|nr:RraA family protein [Pigmentiphaga humi]VCU69397.1 4-hydroxy-4-methyl-2-oxoglutarate aldolase [Pigmentiphaga humi]
MTKTLLGKLDPKCVRSLDIPRPPEGLIEGFKALGDATGIVSDVMDHLNIVGVLPGSLLRPTIAGATIVGPALTVRNTVLPGHPNDNARAHINGMAEIEAHNIAEQGDVLVIEGVPGVSNMGGISAQVGKRQGEIGAIVSGGVRDVAHSRRVGFPVWSSELSPVTGKWRIETIEVNGPVHIHGIRVNPGDIIVADDTGVCFVPRERAAEILELSRKRAAMEDARCDALDRGVPIRDLPSAS